MSSRTRRTLLLRFVLRRSGSAVLIALLLASITFVVARVMPGNPAALIAGPDATPATLQKIERQLGLADPIPSQYVAYLGDLARLDFGVSLQTGAPVRSDLADRLPATLELVAAALLLGTLGGVALGVYGAHRDKGVRAGAVRTLGLVGAAIPEFWLGLVLIAVFYAELGVAPEPFGRLAEGVAAPTSITGLYVLDSLLTVNLAALGSALAHLAMPAFVLAVVVLAPISRVTRAAMRDTLREDFVLAARANGDAGARLLFGRVLPVAAPPVVTMVAMACGFLLAGDALVERVFAWPGVGQYAVQAVKVGDFAALQGAVLVIGLLYVLIFLVADVVAALIDPRSRVLRA